MVWLASLNPYKAFLIVELLYGNSKQKSSAKSYELSLISKPPRMRFLYFISKVEIDINTLQVLFDKT